MAIRNTSIKNDSMQMFKAQITVAVIGLIGSLGGSWLASGAKFEREIESRGEEIRELKLTLVEAQKKIDEQQSKIDKIDAEIEYTKKKVTEVAGIAADLAWKKLKGSMTIFGNSEESDK